MASPIFVLGRNRSGTKWLSNIIANHEDVAAVQHQEHFGILEATDILNTMPVIFGDLSIPENYIGFLECFSQTDFFKLTELKKSYFYDNRQSDSFSFFHEMMDRYARKEGKAYWVQKSGMSDSLYQHFNDAKFIIIIRDMTDNIRSTVALNMITGGKKYKKNLLKLQLKYFTDMAQVEKIRKKDNVYVVKFEDLKTNPKLVTESICNFLGISFDESMLENRFKINTSYGNTISKKYSFDKGKIFSKFDLLKIKLNSILLNSLPSFVYSNLDSYYKRKSEKEILSPQHRKFLSFKLKRQELGW